MPDYLRVHATYNSRVGQPVGIFVAVDHLRRAGRLSADEEALYVAIDDWFLANLPEPPQYADGNTVGIVTWFKTPAPRAMQRRVDTLAGLLSKYDVPWTTSISDSPGEVVYEDEFQVAVIPPTRGEPAPIPEGVTLSATTGRSKQELATDESAAARRHVAYYATELAERATRTPHPSRDMQLDAFLQRCHEAGIRTVQEVGCGSGRDGVRLQDAGLDYHGTDLTPEAIDICTDRGLTATVASAADLPFAYNSFDAAWTMSTLMHLDGDGFDCAVAELGRVVRPGGVLGVGLWGSDPPARRIDEHGRLFVQRSDDQVRAALSTIGEVMEFEVGQWYDGGGHYQFAVLTVG